MTAVRLTHTFAIPLLHAHPKPQPPHRAPQDDPEAAAKFQVLGQAYQILSDEDKRKAYDLHGEAGVSDTAFADAGAVFGALFGNDAVRAAGCLPSAWVCFSVYVTGCVLHALWRYMECELAAGRQLS